MAFINYNVNLSTEQIESLRRLPGSSSKHIRNAIDEYLEKKKKEITVASLSESKPKGESNG